MLKDTMMTPEGAILVLVMVGASIIGLIWLVMGGDWIAGATAGLVAGTLVPGAMIIGGAFSFYLGANGGETKFIYFGFGLIVAGIALAGLMG